jgi:hypothetical protein
MDYQSLDMEETAMATYDNECMICMDGSDDDGRETVVVQRIPHLVRACRCEYLVHEACLRDWLSKNPACPICKECLFYNEPRPPRKRKSSDSDTGSSPSIARCIHRFLCCMSSPDSARRD